MFTTTLALAALLLVAEPPADAVRKDREKLTGTWTVVSAEVNGMQVPAEALKDFQFIFTAEKMTRKKDGKVQSEAGYRIDPTTSPKSLDALGPPGDKQPFVPGLYEVEGDTLKLCFRSDYKNKDGKPAEKQLRPTKLDGGTGTNQVLLVLKREKP